MWQKYALETDPGADFAKICDPPTAKIVLSPYGIPPSMCGEYKGGVGGAGRKNTRVKRAQIRVTLTHVAWMGGGAPRAPPGHARAAGCVFRCVVESLRESPRAAGRLSCVWSIHMLRRTRKPNLRYLIKRPVVQKASRHRHWTTQGVLCGKWFIFSHIAVVVANKTRLSASDARTCTVLESGARRA